MSKLQEEAVEGLSLSERVYLTLKKSILRGELNPGYRLVILDLAASFGVSQAPVREALERLKHEGLLTSLPNRGSMVAALSVEEIREVYELRMLLEAHVLEKTLPILGPQDFEELMAIFQKLCQAAEDDELFAFIDADMEFHGWFYNRHGNQQIISFWNVLRDKTARFTSITNQLYFANLHEISNGHLDLIEILKTNDFPRVKEAYMKHLLGVWHRMNLVR